MMLDGVNEIVDMARLEEQHGSARVKGATRCLLCGWCCHKPCVPSPDELRAIALYLKMDVCDCLRKYFVIGRRGDVYYPKPALANGIEQPGFFVPLYHDEGYHGKCVFLDERNLCSIYEVRPLDARRARCWEGVADTYDPRETWEPNVLAEFDVDAWWLEVTRKHIWPDVADSA